MRAATSGIISAVILIKYNNIFRLCVRIVCCTVDTRQLFFYSPISSTARTLFPEHRLELLMLGHVAELRLIQNYLLL